MAEQDAVVAVPPAAVCSDREVLEAAAEVIRSSGLGSLTLARLGEVMGTSRMTLHRRKITVPAVVAGLAAQATGEYREAMFPALTEVGSARTRLEAALAAVFAVADRHLALLSGLFAADDAIFHEGVAADGARPTAGVFIAPFVRLLADGELDGTLRAVDDAEETATVLFNTAGWGYVQLRHAQGWSAQRARDAVLSLVIGGLVPRGG